MNWSAQDYQYMAKAIQLAKQGLYTTDPNPRVGCVIVKDDRIIGQGWHHKAGGPHAEIDAIQNADGKLNNATCYVSLEPCCHQGKTAACTQALKQTGISKLISAMTDPNPLVSGKGLAELRLAGIEISEGLLSEQASKLNPGFIKRMQQGLPYVRCKLAMSLDAKLALQNGDSQWITSEQARQDGQYLRARSSAIVTGVNTIIADDPSLNVRISNLIAEQPLRVIVDTNLRTPLAAKLLSLNGETIIFTCSTDQGLIQSFIKKGIEVINIETKNKKVDLLKLMQWLADNKQINEVLVEAGAELSGAMINAELVDELVIYQAPVILGNRAKGLVELPELTSMEQRIQLKLEDHRKLGLDEKKVYSINY